jgi:hypothetical protein
VLHRSYFGIVEHHCGSSATSGSVRAQHHFGVSRALNVTFLNTILGVRHRYDGVSLTNSGAQTTLVRRSPNANAGVDQVLKYRSSKALEVVAAHYPFFSVVATFHFNSACYKMFS